MKKNIVITIDIDVDMKGAEEWDDEDEFLIDEVRDVLHEISSLGKNSWTEWQSEIDPATLPSGTTFQFNTDFNYD